MSVGNNIKKFRKEMNISQEELAEAIKCTVDTISRYETGRRCPSLEQAMRLSAYFRKSIDLLFYMEPDFPNEKGVSS